jgi:predicted acyltransferase
MGTSLALSFDSQRAKDEKILSMLYKVVRRSIILFLLGMFIVNAPSLFIQTASLFTIYLSRLANWSTLRIMGVLQRFAIAYFIVGTMRVFTHVHSTQLRQTQQQLLVRSISSIALQLLILGFVWRITYNCR